MLRWIAASAAILAVVALIACDPAYYPGGTAEATWTTPDAQPFQSADTGAMRTVCRQSHRNFSDPIVHPGKPLASHDHTFFGAVGTDWSTTDPRDLERSTCEGGAMNRTAYWVPTMYDADGPINTAPIDDPLQVYYKTGHYDGTTGGTIVPFPPGFRMIAGNARADGPQPERVMYWTCLATQAADSGGAKTPTIPAGCPPGRLIQLTVSFPQCWDGVNLDSPDHQSHMTYGTGWTPAPRAGEGCPASHPVQVPAITEHFRWLVPPEGAGDWHLSADMGGPPGQSGHADWFNGWDPAIQQRWVDRCLNRNIDCRMGLIPWDDGTVRKLGPAVGAP